MTSTSRRSARGARAALLLAALATASLAASVDVPAPGVAIDGPLLGNFTGPLVSQQRFAAADVGDLAPGDRIYAFSFRRDASVGAFTGAHFPRFDVRLGAAATTFVTDFADNFAEAPTLVRAGPIDLTPEHLPSGDALPRPFGAAVLLDAPFVYAGGDLLLEIRSGQPSAPVAIDTLGTPDGQPNAATNGYSTFHAGDVEATSANAVVLRANWPLRLHTLAAVDVAGAGSAVRTLHVKGLVHASLQGPARAEVAGDDLALFLGEGAPLVGERVPALGIRGTLDLGDVGTQVLATAVRDDLRRVLPGATLVVSKVSASFRANGNFSRLKVSVKATLSVNGRRGSYRITTNARLKP